MIYTFVAGFLEDNNYLLVDEETKEAILIDCTLPNDEIDKKINELGVKLKYILLTHGHFDHICGVNYYREKFGAISCCHKDDKELIENIKDFVRIFQIRGDFEVQTIDKFLSDGDEISFGTKKIKVIHTAGHTKGCVCYLLDDVLFSGDTLFKGSVGRTDLPGGSFETLKDSITNKIFTLEGDLKIYTGHGEATTLSYEKKYNNFL
ncbi:MAG: MBL fold metallo-hydrolase [bacterium]|nr:MBL fold metallo-hydrolase [bacterium]